MAHKYDERYESRRATSEFLNRAGFAGIHYVGRQDGECYVIFNEKDAVIVDHSVFRKGSVEEWSEIERRAKVAGVWLKAPDGTDTQLSPEAWVTAQTAGFRVAYGDWERAYGAKWLTSD